MTKKEVTQLSYDIIGCAITVHKELGPGLLESIYARCLKYESEKKRMKVRREVPVPVPYDCMEMDVGLRLDLLVNESVVIETKAIEPVLPVHAARFLTYMKLMKMPQGPLINFHTDNITKTPKPFVNE